MNIPCICTIDRDNSHMSYSYASLPETNRRDRGAEKDSIRNSTWNTVGMESIHDIAVFIQFLYPERVFAPVIPFNQFALVAVENP